MRTSPVSLSAQAPARVPRNKCRRGRHQRALAAAYSPGPLPQVWETATRRRAEDRRQIFLAVDGGPPFKFRALDRCGVS